MLPVNDPEEDRIRAYVREKIERFWIPGSTILSICRTFEAEIQQLRAASLAEGLSGGEAESRALKAERIINSELTARCRVGSPLRTVSSEDIYNAFERDPVTENMNSGQLRRIKYWIRLLKTPTLLISRSRLGNDDIVFVRSSNSTYLDPLQYTDEERAYYDLYFRPPPGAVWESVTLRELLNQHPVSRLYVDSGRDDHGWVSLEEIGNNDDYQP